MTAQLVVLSEEREKKAIQDQEALVRGLKKLLEAAENGELKGVCYATVNTDDELTFPLGPFPCAPSFSKRTHSRVLLTVTDLR